MDSNQILSLVQRQWGAQNFQDAWEIQDWWFWDFIGYPSAGTNEQVYFSVPAGQNDPVLGTVKKKEQTNLQQPSQIGGTDVFIWTGLRFTTWNFPKNRQTGTGVSATTNFAARQLIFSRFLNNLMCNGVAFVSIQTKTWLIMDAPWLNAPQGFGLGTVIPPAIGSSGGTAVTGGANAYMAPSNVDQWALGDTFSFGQPVFLAPNTNFGITVRYQLQNSPSSANCYGNSADQPPTFLTGAIMEGYKVRPRQ